MMPFTPTHRVPPGGMDSWPRPDAQAARGPRIDEGLLVHTTERVGDWAKVVFDNGWSAWVDGRLLAPMQSPGRTAGSAGGAKRVDLAAILADRSRATGIGGALVVLLASVLPWLRGAGASANSYDVRAGFLVDYKSTARSGPTVGVLLLLVAVAVVVAIAAGARQPVTRVLGTATLAVPALYLVQLQRLVGDVPGASLTDFAGIGSVVAAAGAAVVLVAPRLNR